MSKSIYFRIPYDYDEVNVPRLSGIAKSQLQRLLANTEYDDIKFVDTSFIQEEGHDKVLFIVKHELVSGFESVFCYSMFGRTGKTKYEIPLFFSSTSSHDSISVEKLDGIYDVSSIEVALDEEDNCNYTFFI